VSKSGISKFFHELKRRKVIRVAIVYAVIAWLIVEVASVLFPGLLLPEWSVRLVIGIAIIGFPIALVLAWAVEPTPAGLKADTGPEPAAPEAPGSKDAGATVKKGIDSMAVLPFLNLSNDPENEYFSDGMSEEVLNLLCKLPQLTVASRTSSFSFKGKDADMATVARQLGVDAILEGSVRRSGNRVRITAQLIDARKDRHLWSETYDRELQDVFAVQEEIADNIVKALKISLTPEQAESIRKEAATDDMDAYDFYLRGRYYLMQRGEIDHAQSMFNKAIGLDPGFALAWAGLAECHAWKFQWIDDNPEYLEATDEYSRKALELAPDSAEVHTARGSALALIGDYAAAERAIEKAISLDPQLYEAYFYQGRVYFTQGKYRESVEAFRKALEIRPDDPAAAVLEANALKPCGKADEFRMAIERGIRISEKHLALNPDDALALSRAAPLFVDAGRVDEGLELAMRAYRLNSRICGYNVACAHVAAGKMEKALDLLEEHVEQRGVYADWLEKDADWDAVRGDPRFQAVLAKCRRSGD